MASSRRRGNHINKLEVQGIVIDRPGDIREAIVKHFELYFNYSQVVQIKEWCCNLRTLNENSSCWLEQPFTEDEV